MPCGSTYKKKTFLRIFSADKTSSSSYSNPTFYLNQKIENISSFKIIDFFIRYTDSQSQSIKINSRELTNLTTDKIQGTYNGASQTILEIQTQYSVVTDGVAEPDNKAGNRQLSKSPTYQCSNGELGVISFEFKNMDGTTDASSFDEYDKWSMLIEFHH